jgi:hypothetical protein
MSSRPNLARRFSLRVALAGATAAWLLVADPARGAAVLDSFAQGSASNSADLGNTGFTVGTGSDRLLVVAVSLAGSATVSNVSFRGLPATRFTSVGTNQPGSLCRTEIWRLVNPPSGAGFVAVNLSTATAFGVGVVSYSGVDQKNPIAMGTSAIGAVTPIQIGAGVSDARPVVGVACLGGTWAMRAGPDAVAGPGDTTLWDFTERNVVGLGGQQAAQGGATVSWNVTWADPYAWAAVAVTITPAFVPPPFPPPPDAAPDLAPDVARDTRPPNDPMPVRDLAADQSPRISPDAGADEARPEEDAADDAGEIESDADVPTEDAEIEPVQVGDGAAPVTGDPGGATVRDVNLQVGCACRLGHGDRPAGLLWLPLALLLARRRRR